MSDSNVSPLLDKKSSDIVYHLEELLKEAKTGKLVQIALIGICQDDELCQLITRGKYSMEILGGLRILSDSISSDIREEIEGGVIPIV